MKADGNLSPRERARLNQMQNRASRDIYRLNHNNRTTAGGGGNTGGYYGRAQYQQARFQGAQPQMMRPGGNFAPVRRAQFNPSVNRLRIR